MNAELLKVAISNLPLEVKQDTWNKQAVMREWTKKLPLRHQGVLVTSIRGCDGAPKGDASKPLTCMIRRAILNPHDERETTLAGGFFGFNPDKLLEQTLEFLHSLDQYPLHYVAHLMHAAEVIGYHHPEKNI